jgi:putative FmdB family regulatory protein
MPTYEYKCTACGHKFEKFQSITADPIKKCPECGKKKVERLIGTGAGLIFKGSGFYITDYRSEGYKEKAKAESGASGNGEGKGGEKSDKPATESKPAASKTEAASAPAAPKTESKPEPKSKAKTASGK